MSLHTVYVQMYANMHVYYARVCAYMHIMHACRPMHVLCYMKSSEYTEYWLAVSVAADRNLKMEGHVVENFGSREI